MSLRNKIQEELERRILHGLSHEWETALWVLDPSYKESMVKPLFSLRGMKNKWGYWSAEKHEICLSRKLVRNYSWDSVREVLHHEMAHQFAQEVLCARNESPHGPKFLMACSLLRANPKASGNYALLDERVFHWSTTGARDKMMIRIKKLMALAESQNQHEAEAAMAKAVAPVLGHHLAQDVRVPFQVQGPARAQGVLLQLGVGRVCGPVVGHGEVSAVHSGHDRIVDAQLAEH